MGKISDYTRVLVSKLTDVFACDQTDNGTTETKSATVEQIGTAIGTLQNFADLDTSNKNLVDAINEIASYTPVYGNTASGSIATFDTSLALPLQDCTIAINAVQESGTPTPSSPKAISGFTGANIVVNGKNFIDVSIGNLESGTINGSTGATEASNTRVRNTNYHPFPFDYLYEQGYKLTIPNGYKLAMRFYDKNGTYIPGTGWVIGFVPELADYFHNKGVCYVKFVFAKTDDSNITPSDIASIHYQLEVGNQSTTYTPYNSATTAITWQSDAGTVYGGSLDVTSGKLTVTHGITTINDCITNRTTSYTNPVFYGAITGLKPQTASVKCDYFNVIAGSPSASAFANASSNYDFAINSANTGSSIQVFLRYDDYTDVPTLKTNCGSAVVVYELATPTTYQLTPTQISAIVGTNNVFTDTNGNTSVVYACSLKDYIDGQ